MGQMKLPDTPGFPYGFPSSEEYARVVSTAMDRINKQLAGAFAPRTLKGAPAMAEESKVDRAVRERLLAIDEQVEVERRMQLAVRFGEDIYPEGQVLRFQKVVGDKKYTAAAIKVGDRWYLTGSAWNSNVMTWRQFIAWLLAGNTPTVRIEVLELGRELGTREVDES